MNLNQLFENISADQRRVGQLPADFKAPNTSPQLSGPYPGRNATRGYLVGEEAGQDNTIYQVSRAMLDNNPGRSYLRASDDDILRDAARELSRMGMSDVKVRAIMRDPDFAGELIDTLRGPLKNDQMRESGMEEGTEQVYKVIAVTKSNALSKPKKLNVKAGSVDEVFERLAASDWYPLEINGVEVVDGRRLKPGVSEGTNFYDRFGHDVMAQDRKKSQPRLGDIKVKMPGRSPDTQPPKDKKPGVGEGIIGSFLKNRVRAGVTPKEVAVSTVRQLNQRAPGTKMQGHPNFAKFKQEVHDYVASAEDSMEAIRRASDDHVMSLGKKYFKESGVEEAMKPSDIPPTMRDRLTMKDIEAERPAGAYRFRVTFPDGATADFMDFEAAQQRAAADRGRISRLREEKDKGNPRIERILRMLRARHPQAENDLEALIYDFRSQQAQDRSDIARLDRENDMEEADIERLERMLDIIKKRRGAETVATESLRDGEYHVATVTLDDGTVKKVRITSDEGFRDQITNHFRQQGRAVKDIKVDYAVRSQFDESKPTFTGAPARLAPAPLGSTRTLPPAPGRPGMTGRPGTNQERRSIEQDLARRMAAEDVLGDVKRRLGDVLRQRQQKQAERMPQRQVPQDMLGDPVKQIDLGDGNVLMIHGNEDDGFRIHLGKRVMPTRFATLEQAEIATAMFEAKRDACYNKVKSRYKVWPSAYASGALVQCRKKGAANWGTGSKD